MNVRTGEIVELPEGSSLPGHIPLDMNLAGRLKTIGLEERIEVMERTRMDAVVAARGTLEANREKFVKGEMPEYNAGVKVKPCTNGSRGRPPSGTDPAPSRGDIFDRHANHLARRGPRGLKHFMGNIKSN